MSNSHSSTNKRDGTLDKSPSRPTLTHQEDAQDDTLSITHLQICVLYTLLGLSKVEIAERVGVNRNTVYRVLKSERGQRVCGRILRKFQSVTGFTPREFRRFVAWSREYSGK